MARVPTFSVHGLDELALDVRAAGNIPDEVKIDMARSGATVIAEATSKEAKAMGIYDEESNVHIADKIKVSKPNVKKTIKAFVTFSGSRKRGNNRTRNAEIAFINEFGANNKGIAPRPFIKNAIKKSEDEAVEAAAEVFHKWLDTKNL